VIHLLIEKSRIDSDLRVERLGRAEHIREIVLEVTDLLAQNPQFVFARLALKVHVGAVVAEFCRQLVQPVRELAFGLFESLDLFEVRLTLLV
jgi:hypothetical protein